MAVTVSSIVGIYTPSLSSISLPARTCYPCNRTVTWQYSVRYCDAMSVPGAGLVLDIIWGVFGFILLVGIGLTVLFVVLSRSQRDKRAESSGQDHDYSTMPPPPQPPEK